MVSYKISYIIYNSGIDNSQVQFEICQPVCDSSTDVTFMN